MSSKAGSVLVRYQGWAARRSPVSAGSWPWRAYQQTMRVCTSRANGTVRSTARLARLRASPAPSTLRASANACSIAHRAAYRATSAAGAAARSVVTRARS